MRECVWGKGGAVSKSSEEGRSSSPALPPPLSLSRALACAAAAHSVRLPTTNARCRQPAWQPPHASSCFFGLGAIGWAWRRGAQREAAYAQAIAYAMRGRRSRRAGVAGMMTTQDVGSALFMLASTAVVERGAIAPLCGPRCVPVSVEKTHTSALCAKARRPPPPGAPQRTFERRETDLNRKLAVARRKTSPNTLAPAGVSLRDCLGRSRHLHCATRCCRRRRAIVAPALRPRGGAAAAGPRRR